MFAIEIHGVRHVRMRVGRWHLRTWRSLVMILPKGYRSPELAFAVEETDEHGESLGQLGAFFSLHAAEACLSRLESEGFTNLHINMIPIHTRLDDWEFDR
ncbi:hypothetical protein AB0E12_25870 [Micromonospora chersina]|uniref:hypothetical protein n=1 Tax=Micromonospora chersina TaxID=47854 RepID=UPI0034032C1A